MKLKKSRYQHVIFCKVLLLQVSFLEWMETQKMHGLNKILILVLWPSKEIVH